MLNILEFFIKKIKGDNFKIDKEINVGYLLNRVSSMIINLIRGNIKTILVDKKTILFL